MNYIIIKIIGKSSRMAKFKLTLDELNDLCIKDHESKEDTHAENMKFNSRKRKRFNLTSSKRPANHSQFSHVFTSPEFDGEALKQKGKRRQSKAFMKS